MTLPRLRPFSPPFYPTNDRKYESENCTEFHLFEEACTFYSYLNPTHSCMFHYYYRYAIPCPSCSLLGLAQMQ
jgi:hypothetical protein